MSEEQEKVNITKPDDRITVKVNGEDKELLMSAGMLRELSKLIGEYEDVSVVYVDAGVQERCLLTLMVDRNERGQPTEPISELTLFMFDMSTEDADKIAKWVGDHVVNFIITGASNMKESVQVQEKMFQNLAQSLSGMNNSIQSAPSAGGTISQQAG